MTRDWDYADRVYQEASDKMEERHRKAKKSKPPSRTQTVNVKVTMGRDRFCKPCGFSGPLNGGRCGNYGHWLNWGIFRKTKGGENIYGNLRLQACIDEHGVKDES